MIYQKFPMVLFFLNENTNNKILKATYPNISCFFIHISLYSFFIFLSKKERSINSIGGANSYWNLLLHLVEKYSDRETAILASKYYAIDIDRDSQAAFAVFKGKKNTMIKRY